MICFIAKYQHVCYSVIYTTLLFCSLHLTSFSRKSCLLRTQVFWASSLYFSSMTRTGFLCGANLSLWKSAFVSIHENGAKRMREKPRPFWHPEPEQWVNGPQSASPGPGPSTGSTIGNWGSWFHASQSYPLLPVMGCGGCKSCSLNISCLFPGSSPWKLCDWHCLWHMGGSGSVPLGQTF